MEVKIVVGANYGDEGKGMAAAYFSKQAYENRQKCLNILYNGSCQRGHTVELKDGIKHVVHHFGSGTFYGAHTYFDSHFILNPIFFREEYEELSKIGYKPTCSANHYCPLSTPFDAILNQIFERGRGKNKHGSCGFGVFETIKRNENEDYSFLYTDFLSAEEEEIIEFLWKIVKEYVPMRLKEMGHEEIPETEKDILGGKLTEGIINHYIQDLYFMQKHCAVIYFEKHFVERYDTVIYEGAQGLALDMNNLNDFPYLTPSQTTPIVPIKTIVKDKWDITPEQVEICYVTRSYMTRHGAGPLPTECKKEEINSDIEDLTNVPNPFQDTLRYGKFDFVGFENRIKMSIGDICEVWGGFYNFKKTTFLTYADSNPNEKGAIRNLFGDIFDDGYYSNTKYIEGVKKWRE